MHWLLLGLYGAMQGAIGYLAMWFSKRVAITLGIVTVWLGILAGFTAGIDVLLGQIGSLVPPAISNLMWGFIPGNVSFCLATLTAAYLGAAVYKSKSWLLQVHAAGG